MIFSNYADFLDQMSLMWAILLLPVGLFILIKGADWLVDGAVAIAKHLGMSPLIIGLSIVAMGTSAPEVATSIKAALSDLPGIAVGNVYGSNIANLALVGGLCAVIRPIQVSRYAIRRDIPLMLIVALLLLFFFHDAYLGRVDSVIMLVLFMGIMAYMIHSERIYARQTREVQHPLQAIADPAVSCETKSFWLSALIIVAGLVLLSEGADLTVSSARIIGREAGMSESAIGATIIALGTSLPELMTCLIASFRGHDDLSIGNLVGSNIFNTLLVVGASGLAKPYSISATPELAGTYYWLMVGVMVLFSVIAFMTRKISRGSGLILCAVYVGYIAYSLFGIPGN